jgi:uncharacterized phage protein (predicted DNA packaging)
MIAPEDFVLLKQYMRVDHNDDDNLIKSLWNAAVEMLTGMNIPDSIERFKQAARSLTLHWYDNPGAVGKYDLIPLGLRELINQLKMEFGGVDYF